MGPTVFGEAKFWLEPIISLENYAGLSTHTQLNFLQKVVEGHNNETIKKWKKHFKTGSN